MDGRRPMSRHPISQIMKFSAASLKIRLRSDSMGALFTDARDHAWKPTLVLSRQ